MDYIFSVDGTKICRSKCTSVCSAGRCDGGHENNALSFSWAKQLLETGGAACGTLGYDNKDEFIVDLKANAGLFLENALDSAWGHKDEPGFEYDACKLIRHFLLHGCGVNALIPPSPEFGLPSMTALQAAVYSDLPFVCQYLRKCGGVQWEEESPSVGVEEVGLGPLPNPSPGSHSV